MVADNIEDIISQPSWDIAAIAARDAQEKPSSWDLADAGLELAIAMASILGGVYGIKFTGFLKQARQKSIALREIVNGNEMLKRQNSTLSAEFRTAHINQSPQTKQIVITCNKDGELARTAQQDRNSLCLLLPEETNDQSLVMTSSFSTMAFTAIGLYFLDNLDKLRSLAQQLGNGA